jgi:hypothetical protein
LTSQTTLNVQYGCGLSCPAGWQNFDSSARLRLERIPGIAGVIRASGKGLFPAAVRYGDIVKGLSIAGGSVEALYCSHVLEHLDRESIVSALANSLALLKPGGTFRLVVPDLTWRAERFLSEQDQGNCYAADNFMEGTYLGDTKPHATLTQKLRRAFGNSAHLWMYDYALLCQLLADAGFAEIRRCKFGDSEIEAFSAVEDESRFIDAGVEELAIEARRPMA